MRGAGAFNAPTLTGAITAKPGLVCTIAWPCWVDKQTTVSDPEYSDTTASKRGESQVRLASAYCTADVRAEGSAYLFRQPVGLPVHEITAKESRPDGRA